MSGTDQSHAPRIKDLRTIALRWYELRDIKIFIEMKKVAL
jgi:hypothetical protein